MPKPHPLRDKFLKYLRGGFAHDMPWIDLSGVFMSDEIRRAIKKVSSTDPVLHRILDYYIRTRMPRMRIADAVHYDSSTVKRKLDEAVDLILQNLHNEELASPANMAIAAMVQMPTESL